MHDDEEMKMQEHADKIESSYPVKQGGTSLEEMFERMEIKMVGRENEDNKSDRSFGGDEDSEEDDLNQTMYREDNKIS